MVQQSETAGTQPTEQSPLLGKSGNIKGKGGAYVSIEEVVDRDGFVFKNAISSSSSSASSRSEHGHDEENQSQIIGGEVEEAGIGRNHVVRIISVLLIGVFVGHADSSILLATHPVIASEFNDLANSTWLITGFALAGAATQTLYGKLSDIYGRKTLVIISYAIFVAGCAVVGMGQTMWQVILGRIISGAGASGMGGLVSILITDLLPIKEVAQWRAYVNLIATLGRSLGGPLGGWLVDVIGWRWSFFGQVPPILIAILLVAVYLPAGNLSSTDSNATDTVESQKSKFSRIDFKGSILIALTILTLLLPIELGGAKLPWTHPIIFTLVALSAVFLFVFILVEKRAKEPILPLEIFHKRDAVFSFLILGFQLAAQLGLMFSVPLYFQVTSGASNTASGAHLVPAVFGNALGGIVSGVLIKRSGRYKTLIILAAALSSLSYLILMFRWHGNTNLWESLYIFPTGLGTGIAQSAVFISLTAVVDPAHMAPAISFMYLSVTIAVTLGMPLANSVMQTVLRARLESRLPALGLGVDEVRKIIESTISDVGFVNRVTGSVHDTIVRSYVDGLKWSHGVSFLFSATAFSLALFIRQKPLGGARS